MKLQDCSSSSCGWRARVTLFLACFFFLTVDDHYVQATITASGRTSRGREVFFFDSMPADFGMEIPLDSPVQVQLKHLPDRPYLCSSEDANRLLQSEMRVDQDNPNGTASSTIDTTTTETGLPVALLVYRGKCSFEVKAQQAALLNIPYLIVADMNEEESDLITMNAPPETTKDVGLLFVTWQTGAVLKEFLDHVTIGSSNDDDDNAVILSIDGKIPGEEEDTLANLVLRLFIWVGIISFCFAPRAHWGIPGLSSTSPLTEEQVLQLPTVKHGDTGEENDQHSSHHEESCCSICLEEYNQDEMLRQLPCHHEFHTECIVQWLTRSRQQSNCCPLCKQEVTLEDDDGANNKKWWRLPTWRRRQGRILVSTSEQNDDDIELVTGLDSSASTASNSS